MPRRTQTRLTKSLIDKANHGQCLWDSEVSGFGLRVTPAGSKSFVFQYRSRSNQQGRVVLGRYPSMTVEQARKSAREQRVHVDQGGNPSADRRETRTAASLRDLADYYCDEVGPARGLKKRTLLDARRLLDRFALPRFGSRKVADIKASDVRAMHHDACAGAGRYQANRLRAALSRMFTLAIQREWRTDNPCRGVEKFPEDQRWDHLSDKQVRKLLSACESYHDPVAANAVRLLLFTGARLREVLKAEWSQFDLEGGVWTKPSSHTKTRMVHRVPIAPPTLELLKRMQLEALSPQFLFPGRDGLKPRADLKRPWRQILAAADIGHFRLHDLRRTTASFMLSTGSELMTVGKSLGHTQASTTLRYAQLSTDVQRQGLARAIERMSPSEPAIATA